MRLSDKILHLKLGDFMRFIPLVLFLLACVSCLTLTEEQKMQMVKETVVETKLNKNEIFNAAAGALAKSLGNSNAAIRVSDKEDGKIISRLARACGFRNAGATVSLKVTYNMTLIAKDTKYKLMLEPVEWTNGYVYPDFVEDMNKCTDALQKDLVADIEKAASDKDF